MRLFSQVVFISLLIFLFFPPRYTDSQVPTVKKNGLQITIINFKSDSSQDFSQTVSFIPFDTIKTFPAHLIKLHDSKSKQDITWKGASLKEIFSVCLKLDWQEINRLAIKAPDGYSSTISGMRLAEAKNGICAFAIEGTETWKKKYGEIRIIFPDLHEMLWINNPHQITIYLSRHRSKNLSWRFHFFENSVFQPGKKKSPEGKDYFAMTDILKKLAAEPKGFSVFSKDGQWREFSPDDRIAEMVLLADSAGTWKITGSGVPIGFRLKRIFFLAVENSGLFLKSLSTDEQPVWQELMQKMGAPFESNQTAREIIIILGTGEKVPSKYFREYSNGEISLYHLLQAEKENHGDLKEILVSW